jgi:hypothetical protein
MAMNYHCSNCSHDAESVVVRRGDMRIQIFLWFFFIIPGLFYSMWRATTKQTLCGACGSEDVQPMQAHNRHKDEYSDLSPELVPLAG